MNFGAGDWYFDNGDSDYGTGTLNWIVLATSKTNPNQYKVIAVKAYDDGGLDTIPAGIAQNHETTTSTGSIYKFSCWKAREDKMRHYGVVVDSNNVVT